MFICKNGESVLEEKLQNDEIIIKRAFVEFNCQIRNMIEMEHNDYKQ